MKNQTSILTTKASGRGQKAEGKNSCPLSPLGTPTFPRMQGTSLAPERANSLSPHPKQVFGCFKLDGVESPSVFVLLPTGLVKISGESFCSSVGVKDFGRSHTNLYTFNDPVSYPCWLSYHRDRENLCLFLEKHKKASSSTISSLSFFWKTASSTI